MMSESVLLEKKESIAILTLNRPEVKNAIDRELAATFRHYCDEIKIDDSLRVVIITGTGERAFSAGTDPKALDGDESAGNVYRALRLTPSIELLDLPTIAAVNGDALGQGLELALACDYRICVEHSLFGMTQLSDRQMPFDGGTQRLHRVVGKARALDMILLGEPIDSGEALNANLVSKITTSHELRIKALDVAGKIAEKGPVAVKYARESVYKGMDMTMEQGLRLEADLYFLLHTTRDRTEGIQAYHEKRNPIFKGK